MYIHLCSYTLSEIREFGSGPVSGFGRTTLKIGRTNPKFRVGRTTFRFGRTKTDNRTLGPGNGPARSRAERRDKVARARN